MSRRAKFVFRSTITAFAAAAVLIGIVVVWRSSAAVHSSTRQVLAQNELQFVARPYVAPPNPGFDLVSASQVYLSAARFQDHLYMAGPGGLMEYDSHGSLLHQYAAGRELPGSPLVVLASGVLADSREPELLIGTESAGVLAFNGRDFRQILPTDGGFRSITAMLATASGHLLFGTKKRGVLLYDGKRISALHPLLTSDYVTSLAGSESDLWVGTLNRGVLHYHGGEIESLSVAAGLPDEQVQSLAVSGNTTYVGTATGVAVFNSGHFSRVLAPGVFATSLLATPEELYVGSEDQGVIGIPLVNKRFGPNANQPEALQEVHQLFAFGNDVFAVARTGLFRKSAHGFAWDRLLEPTTSSLTDRNISALASDASGQIWVGFFDRGLDLLPAGGGRSRHVEDEHVFCVNRILPEAKSATVDVATANGLVRFNQSGDVQQVLTRSDGLIADHITDVVDYRSGLALATPAGLTFLDSTGARSMYAFHGLVNNHIYALAASGDELMAGTLGGLSQLQQGTVQANYTTTSSGLKHNWITALARVDHLWMVGTYGAGVLSLDESGHFHAFDVASDQININPNAMLVTPHYVLAGSLGQGLYLYDRQSGRWSVIRDGLPSLNITAFTSANSYIYVGTDNGLVRIPEARLHP
jgi:ligand-binding sensor domain-containing protein